MPSITVVRYITLPKIFAHHLHAKIPQVPHYMAVNFEDQIVVLSRSIRIQILRSVPFQSLLALAAALELSS